MTYAPPPCQVCGVWTEVLETRRRKTGVIARRIECANLHRFTLYDTSTEERHAWEIAQRSHAGAPCALVLLQPR